VPPCGLGFWRAWFNLKSRGLVVAREWWHHGFMKATNRFWLMFLALVLGFILFWGWAMRGSGGLWISH
jgi:hypothetical protein